MTRGPSLQAEPLLNTPSPHSRVVERLRERAEARCAEDRARYFTSIMKPEDHLEWQAAALIAELEAERECFRFMADKNYKLWADERDLRIAAESSLYLEKNRADNLADNCDRLQSELDTANNNHRSIAHQLAETGERALAAESSLHRVRAETIEECAKVAENLIFPILPDQMTTRELIKIQRDQISARIRYLAAESSEWQHIEVAPVDTAILVYDFGYDVAHFNSLLGKWVACWDHRPIRITERTVWQPLPAPPAAAETNARDSSGSPPPAIFADPTNQPPESGER